MSDPLVRLLGMEARDYPELMADMDRHFRSMNRSLLELLDCVREFVAGYPQDTEILAGMGTDLTARYGIPKGRAWDWIEVADALPSLPHVRGAFARGELSFEQVRELIRFVTPETDQHWSVQARGMEPQKLRREARRATPPTPKEAKSDHAERYLWKEWSPDGRVLHF